MNQIINNKKNLAVVLGATKDMTFALANVLIGLKKYFRAEISEIIIYHDGICQKDLVLLNQISKCLFIKYEFPSANLNKNLNEYGLKTFTLLSFCKYECFKFLHQFKQIIWLDIDILIQDDFSELLNIKAPIGLLKNSGYVSENFSENIQGFDMNNPLYGTGTIVFNETLQDYDKLANWCYDKTIEYAPILKYPDQGIINLLIQNFNIDIEPIDMAVYCCHPLNMKICKNPKIIHSYSPLKFWNYYKFNEWEKNNKIWISMGGSAYKGKKYNIWNKFIYKIFPGAPNILKQPRRFFKYLKEVYK